jgi:hypothetical protein
VEKSKWAAPIQQNEFSSRIIRGQRVLLDTDLASIYEVEPDVLRDTVKRNIEHFPDDFMFQLTEDEVEDRGSQKATRKRRTRTKSLPYAFTEQGVLMLSTVLRSKRAIQANIEIARAFTDIIGQIPMGA